MFHASDGPPPQHYPILDESRYIPVFLPPYHPHVLPTGYPASHYPPWMTAQPWYPPLPHPPLAPVVDPPNSHVEPAHSESDILSKPVPPLPVAESSSACTSVSKVEPETMSTLKLTQSLPELREIVRVTQDPLVQLDYAHVLIQSASNVSRSDTRTWKKQVDSLYQEALKYIKKATSGGACPEAHFFLASCYGNGSIGLAVDHTKAFNLYLQASKLGHAASCYRVAVCYEVGAGTKKDVSRSMQYYRKAAALGDTAAMFKVGMVLLNGLLQQTTNIKEGLSWLKRSAGQADEHNPHALHELAALYEQETSLDVDVISPDPVHAYHLYLRAAQFNYAPSQYKLGVCYEHGLLNLPVNPRRSIAWYTRAAEKGSPEAELALSGWYLTGAEGILQESGTDAYLWARKAADKGLGKAEYAVGYYHEKGVGVARNVEEARRWYMRAAAQGNQRAIHRLDDWKKAIQQHTLSRSSQKRDKDCTIM